MYIEKMQLRGRGSTICGLFEPGKVAEQVLYRNMLVSFALPEAVLAAARGAVSGSEAADADETAGAEGAQQMASSEAMALAAQAAAEREQKHVELMKKGARQAAAAESTEAPKSLVHPEPHSFTLCEAVQTAPV